MELQTGIIAKASAFVFDLFKDHLSEHLVYHTFEHTEEVAHTAQKIGRAMKLGDEGLEIVALAAWFHDTGYTEKYVGHEEVSTRFATNFLEQENYPQEKIDLIVGCIRATKIPQQPGNLLEMVVADADLSGLGKKSFFRKSDLLHREWEQELNKKYTESEWIQQNIKLLTGHKFFTPAAQQFYNKRQSDNLQLLNKRLQKLPANIGREISSVVYPFTLENRNFNDSGKQMVFKLVSNTLMMENLSADHKALIMIFANALIILISFSVLLLRAFHRSSMSILEIPFIILCFVSILTMILSILSLRRLSGNKQNDEEPIRSPFFGMFYAMSYDDFDRRMKDMDEENDLLLYGKMTQEYFDQRFIVAKKYQLLQLSYTVFMYGFCFAALTFAIFIILKT